MIIASSFRDLSFCEGRRRRTKREPSFVFEWRNRASRLNLRIWRSFAEGVIAPIFHLLIHLLHAVSILLSSSVVATTTKRGTMNWDPTTRRMLPNSTTVVGLRTRRRQAAPPASMFLMMNDHGNNIRKLLFTQRRLDEPYAWKI